MSMSLAILKAINSVAELGNTVAGWLLSEEGYAEWKNKRSTSKLQVRAYEAIKNKNYEELDTIISDLKQR